MTNFKTKVVSSGCKFSDKIRIYPKAQRRQQGEDEVRVMCGSCRKLADIVKISDLDNSMMLKIQDSVNGKWMLINGLCEKCAALVDADPNTSEVKVVVAEMCRQCRKIARWAEFSWAYQQASVDIQLGDKGWWAWSNVDCEKCVPRTNPEPARLTYKMDLGNLKAESNESE